MSITEIDVERERPPENLYVLIMAGGRGTRFWPLSRRSRPKQCLTVVGERSLIRQTVDRLDGLVPKERILVITAEEMATAVIDELPDLPGENILVEPMGRNTAPCVGWGATVVGRLAGGSDAVMAVLPADHLIHNEEGFRQQLRECAAAARETNSLVTVGVSPTRPETGFGYLHVGGFRGRWGDSELRSVSRFVEKPNLELAKEYLAGGEHLWNAGMFIFSVEAIRDAFRNYLPESWGLLEQLRIDPGLVGYIYPKLEAISLDYGIMERAAQVLTVEAHFDWSDLGGWVALGDELDECEMGRARVADSLSIDSSENIVFAPGKSVALIGVEGLVVVDTEDALLICRKEDAQRIKEVTSLAEARERLDLL